ncbi:MAG: hypothetical protein QOK37_1527 [Thermoanaerobaculia bacterium]|nr:hypothetical protein [Thermoanaerobaculia bacterium]
MNSIDPEFRQILLRVVLVGSSMMLVGAAGLYFAFRAFASPKKGRDFRAVVGIISVLAVVMMGCLILLIFSYGRR